MNLKKINLLVIFALTYCFFHILETRLAIKPNLIQRLSFDHIFKSNSVKDILKALIKQEKSIWIVLEKILCKTKQECITLKQHNEWATEYKELEEKIITEHHTATPISQENYHLAHEVFNDFNVDAQSVTLVQSNSLSPASSTDTTLFINEELFNTMEPLVQEFILAHEISHIIMKDHSTDFVIAKLKELQNINSDELNQAINLLSQFIEARADILASLHNEEYTLGHILFMVDELSFSGNTPYDDYPLNTTRLDLGEKILDLHASNTQI